MITSLYLEEPHKTVVIYRRCGNNNQWQPQNRDEGTITTDKLLDHLRSALTYQLPPTPEERAVVVYETLRRHWINGTADYIKDQETIAREIQAAIDADREER